METSNDLGVKPQIPDKVCIELECLPVLTNWSIEKEYHVMGIWSFLFLCLQESLYLLNNWLKQKKKDLISIVQPSQKYPFLILSVILNVTKPRYL